VEENAANGLASKNDRRVATRRSLEGLGYLGMLSASPTDMGPRLLQQAEELEQQSAVGTGPVCSAFGWFAKEKADHAAVGTIRLGCQVFS
jgi:hypothetical protein